MRDRGLLQALLVVMGLLEGLVLVFVGAFHVGIGWLGHLHHQLGGVWDNNVALDEVSVVGSHIDGLMLLLLLLELVF